MSAEPMEPKIESSSERQSDLKRASVEVTIGASLTTLDGNNVTLKCEARGTPAPRLSWTKDGVAVEGGGDSLLIEDIQSDDTGSYTCTATNLLGSSSDTSIIAVKSKSTPVRCEVLSSFLWLASDEDMRPTITS